MQVPLGTKSQGGWDRGPALNAALAPLERLMLEDGENNKNDKNQTHTKKGVGLS